MRTDGRPLALIALMAMVLLLPACNDSEGGEGALGAEYSLQTGESTVPLDSTPLQICCEEGIVARVLVGEVAVLDRNGDAMSTTFPSQFEEPPVAGTRYLGFSLSDVEPPGALSFRWDGPFVADLNREENERGDLMPFDPDVDVGEPYGFVGDGVYNVLEVSAARCDFEQASFTMVVFEFSYLANPTQGAGIFVYRTLRREVVIENTCPSPSPPPAGGLIVFSNTPPVGAPDRDAEVWTLDLATGISTQLTDNVQIADMDPAWSPDRSEIAFVSNRVSPAGGDFDLVVMEADGTNPEVVTSLDPLDHSADDPAWSPVPGERRIAFSQGRTGFGDNDLWILDLNEPEASPTRLRQLTTGANRDFSPTWSPDGASIAFVRTGAIYVVPASGGAPTLLFAPPDDDDAVLAIDWGPAGIVFDTYTFAVSRIRLARIDDSGGSRADVTSGGGHLADATPSWATTSASAVFDRQAEAAHRLFTVDIDNGGPNEAEEIAGQPDGENRDPDCGYGPVP